MHDHVAVTSDWLGELFTPGRLPKRVQNGSIHRGFLATGGAPWTDDTLRSISKPSEPDRHSGRSQGHSGAPEADYWLD